MGDAAHARGAGAPRGSGEAARAEAGCAAGRRGRAPAPLSGADRYSAEVIREAALIAVS